MPTEKCKNSVKQRFRERIDHELQSSMVWSHYWFFKVYLWLSWFAIYKYIIAVTEIILKKCKKIFWLASLNFLEASPENATCLLGNIKTSTTLWSSLKISVCPVSLLKNFRMLNMARKGLINIYFLRRLTYFHSIICLQIHNLRDLFLQSRIFDVDEIFLSPQVKRILIISNNHGIYELLHEFPNLVN